MNLVAIVFGGSTGQPDIQFHQRKFNTKLPPRPQPDTFLFLWTSYWVCESEVALVSLAWWLRYKPGYWTDLSSANTCQHSVHPRPP